MKISLKNAYLILIMTIIITLIVIFGWEYGVTYLINQYVDAHPEYYPRKYMATLQLMIIFIAFIVNLAIAIIYFRSKLWAWGIWMPISTLLITQPYLKIFGMACDISAYSYLIDPAFIYLNISQILIALIVRYFYFQ